MEFSTYSISELESPVNNPKFTTERGSTPKLLLRKQNNRNNDWFKKNQREPSLQIRYYSPKHNQTLAESMKSLQYLCNKRNDVSLQVQKVASITVQNCIPNQQIQFDSKSIQQRQNSKILKHKKSNDSLLDQTNRLKIQNKILRNNLDKLKYDYDKQQKISNKNSQKIRLLEQDLKIINKKNIQLEDLVKNYMNKIVYLQKQIQIKMQIINKKTDKSQIDYLKCKNLELQCQNRDIKNLLHKSNEELKYLQIQLSMLRKKKHQTLNLEMKCLKLNQKNRYLLQKVQKFSNQRSKTQHSVQAQKSSFLFTLTPQFSPDHSHQKPKQTNKSNRSKDK